MQPLPAVMATWSAALRPRVNFGAVNPETNQVDAYGFRLRTGLGEFEPRWVSSSPDVVAVSPTTPEGYPGTTLQPVGLGVAEITISNPPLPILSGVNNRIEVVSPGGDCASYSRDHRTRPGGGFQRELSRPGPN
jgi:hypothetical protein